MYDELCTALEQAIVPLSWYALGEAIRLRNFSTKVCRSYRENSADERCRQNLLAVARSVQTFLLQYRGAPNARMVAEVLNKTVTSIQLESRS